MIEELVLYAELLIFLVGTFLYGFLAREVLRNPSVYAGNRAFLILALSLAAIGIFGVLHYSVAQRTHEFGIRMALGAQARDVLRMILRQGLGLTIVGVCLGIAGALALTRVLSSFLFGLTPTDSLTFAGVTLLVVAVAALACYLPARRATKVDPLAALRHG